VECLLNAFVPLLQRIPMLAEWADGRDVVPVNGALSFMKRWSSSLVSSSTIFTSLSSGFQIRRPGSSLAPW
jgi:hypothetical protein